MNNGLYVAYVGISGCGKDTQINLLESYFKKNYNDLKDIVDFTREPGGTLFADHIRSLVKTQTLPSETEMEYYAIARANSLANRVRPNLDIGKLVISNRCIICSFAYQGFGRELGLSTVWEANQKYVDNTVPDVVVFLDVGREVALTRSGAVDPDKFDHEKTDFWTRVENGYPYAIEFFQNKYPDAEIICICDKEGKLSPDETFGYTMKGLEPHIVAWRENREIIIARERAF